MRLHDDLLELASPASKNNPFQQAVIPTMAGTAMKQLFQKFTMRSIISLLFRTLTVVHIESHYMGHPFVDELLHRLATGLERWKPEYCRL